MSTKPAHALPLHVLLTAATLLLAAGCQWMASGSKDAASPGGDGRGLAELREDNRRLNAALNALKLDLVGREAELDSTRLELDAAREEMATLKGDLEYVERQFVTIERGLVREETKASAVSAIAETRTLMDRLRGDAGDPLDEATIADVERKLQTASELTNRRNYPAAVYYAQRAMRMLNRAERVQAAREAKEASLLVSATWANMREGPGTSFSVVERLDRGTRVTRLAAHEDWYQVRTESGRLGWIHHTLVR